MAKKIGTITEQQYAHLSISNMFEDHLLQAILTLVQDGICFLSEELDVLYANPAMRFWYDLKGGSIAKKCYEAYHDRSTPCENCPALSAIKSGQPTVEDREYEVGRIRKGWQRVFCMPIQDKRDGTLLVIEYVRDITNEKRGEMNIELMKQQIEALSELIKQKEQEREDKRRLFVGNMNRSIDVVLRYLKKILDDDSYELVKNQLNISNNGGEHYDTVENLLSDQEMVIARYIANGYMSKEIADVLSVSKKTIDYHRTNIRKKLELKAEDNLKYAIIKYFSRVGLPQI